MAYAPHQQRVVDETAELDDRLTKLNSFFDNAMFASLDDAEQERMKRQASAMTSYLQVLQERIAAFS